MTIYVSGPISGRYPHAAVLMTFVARPTKGLKRYPHAAVLIPQDIYEPSPEVAHCPALVWC